MDHKFFSRRAALGRLSRGLTPHAAPLSYAPLNATDREENAMGLLTGKKGLILNIANDR